MSSTYTRSFILIFLFLITHAAMCFNIKKYSIVDKDCVFVKAKSKCKLIDSSEDRKIALCDRRFFQVYCNTKIFVEECMVCYPESNKFLDPQEYGSAFVNVLIPGHIFFFGSVTVNGTWYHGVYEIKLENDEAVIVNNKVYNGYSLVAKDAENIEKRSRTKRGVRVRRIRIHSGSRGNGDEEDWELLVLTLGIFSAPVFFLFCCYCCIGICCGGDTETRGTAETVPDSVLQATPMPWYNNHELFLRDYSVYFRPTTNL